MDFCSQSPRCRMKRLLLLVPTEIFFHGKVLARESFLDRRKTVIGPLENPGHFHVERSCGRIVSYGRPVCVLCSLSVGELLLPCIVCTRGTFQTEFYLIVGFT